MAIGREQGVDLRCLKRREEECLPIQVAALIQSPQSHTREVHPSTVTGPQMKVTEHMLAGEMGSLARDHRERCRQ